MFRSRLAKAGCGIFLAAALAATGLSTAVLPGASAGGSHEQVSFAKKFPRHWPGSPRRHRLKTKAPPAIPSFSANLRGGLASAGNTLLTCPDNLSKKKKKKRKGRKDAPSCLNANNNDRDMRYVNVDPGGGRFDSSSATLSIPSDARVVRAFLYWGADLAPGVQNGPADAAPGGATPTGNDLWRTVRMSVAGGPYLKIDAQDPNRDGKWAGVVSWYSQPGNRPGFAYQVRADVTPEVRLASANTKRRGKLGARLASITVANVQAGKGYNRHGGWTLLVAWESPTAPWRDVTVFDGFDFVQVSGGQQLVVGPLDFTGFRTPASGDVDAHVTTWTYEGDRGITGDYLALGTLGVPCNRLPLVSDAANPENNFFNSSISRAGVSVTSRNPAHINQLGFDLDTPDIREGTIPNDATGASACLGTVGDTYFFGGIAFDVLIRAPNVHIAKAADRSQANPGDVVTYTTKVTNPERTPDDPLYPTPTVAATNMVVNDRLPSGLDFVNFASNPGGVCSYDAATRGIGCAVGTLAPNETFTYSYRAEVDGAAQGLQPAPLVNTACYRSNSEDEPDSTYFGCDEANVVVPPNPHVDLGVVKTVSADTAHPGDSLTWEVTGTNYGPGTSTGFVLADELPAGVLFVSASPSAGLTCTTPAVGANGAVTCTAPSVPAGSSLSVMIVGTVPADAADGSVLTNVATVNGDQPEPVPDPHPNRDTADTRVIVPDVPVPPEPPEPPPDPDGPPEPPTPPFVPPVVPPGPAGTKISLVKQALQKRARRGATVGYRLRVTNTGEASVKNLRICDTPASGLTLLPTRSFNRSGRSGCINVGTLGVGRHKIVELTGLVSTTASSFVVNRASARGSNTRAARAHAAVRILGGLPPCSATGSHSLLSTANPNRGSTRGTFPLC